MTKHEHIIEQAHLIGQLSVNSYNQTLSMQNDDFVFLMIKNSILSIVGKVPAPGCKDVLEVYKKSFNDGVLYAITQQARG